MIKSCVVRIRTEQGRVVGAGFLVDQRRLLTCAHVIDDALSRPRNTQDYPSQSIIVEFPLVAPKDYLRAQVTLWQPRQLDLSGDIAALVFDGEAPKGSEPTQLLQADDLWGHRFRTFGFPRKLDDGVWASGLIRGRTGAGWLQIEDAKAPGYQTQPGFSGAPVWDEHLHGVIGMVVTARRNKTLRRPFCFTVDYFNSHLADFEIPCPRCTQFKLFALSSCRA